MIFQSELRRQTLINLCLICIPHVIIAAVISAYMDGGIVGFGIGLAALVILDVVYWILQSIVMWAGFFAVGWRFAQLHIYDYLVANRYPKPNEYETSSEAYFSSVMQNNEVDPELRMKAAVEAGTFAAYSGALDRQRLAQAEPRLRSRNQASTGGIFLSLSLTGCLSLAWTSDSGDRLNQ